jgi:hypothetical protein
LDQTSEHLGTTHDETDLLEVTFKELTVYDTEKAWSMLKNEGVWDLEPELVTYNPFQYQCFSEDTESMCSLPTHNIPYKSDESVGFFVLQL